jgi:uncharacterized membrane protein YfcA
MDYKLALAGALTGFLVGLTGVGGGALMTPLLLLVFGVPSLSAVGTDLWFAAITKSFATKVHSGHGLIDWSVVKRLWMGSLPASAATIAMLKLTSVGVDALLLLKAVIAAAVIVTAIAMIFQKPLQAMGRRFRTTQAVRFKSLQSPLTVLAGAMLGTLVTLTSVGAGALGAVCLSYLYPLRLTPRKLIATDIAHAIPVAVFAGLGHLMIGNVDGGLLMNLLLGSVPGVIIGAMLSARLPQVMLRILLAIVLFSIGTKLLMTLLGQ